MGKGEAQNYDDRCAWCELDLLGLQEESRTVVTGGAPGGPVGDGDAEEDCTSRYLSLRCLANMYNFRRNASDLLFRPALASGRLDPLDGVRALAFLWVTELHLFDMIGMAQYAYVSQV